MEFPAYTQIRSQFQNICHNANQIPNTLSHQNYGDLGTLLKKDKVIKSYSRIYVF
jgi:hypothetical protein